MVSASQIIESAQKSVDIADQLPSALIFAVCKDGSVYCLENLSIRPPFSAVPVYPEKLVERLRGLPQKS